jgi:hypothetical protein
MNLGNRGSGQFTVTASILRALGLRNDDLGSVSFLPTSEFERAFCDQGNPLSQRNDPHAAIDQHVAITPPDMPHVAAVKFLNMRLVDPGDAV